MQLFGLVAGAAAAERSVGQTEASMTWRCSLILLVTVLAGCAASAPPADISTESVGIPSIQPEKLPLVTGVSFQAVIFPIGSGEAPHAGWTPTTDDIAVAEPGVQRCMDTECSKCKRPLSRYYRQYFGLIRDQRRILVIRLFDASSFPDLDWRRKSIYIFDAPFSFAELRYDMQAGTCERG